MKALLPIIAAAYDRAVSRGVEPRREYYAWRALAAISVVRANIIRRDYLVIETDVAQPYATAEEMFEDCDNGRIYVSTANSEHPLFNVHENTALRLVHDVEGHYAAHIRGVVADFSWEGELNAFASHALTLPPDTRPGMLDALFTEVVGQAAYALHNGKFGEQKVAFLW